MSQFLERFNDKDLPVARTSLSGTFLDANSAYQKLVGYSLPELKKMSFQDITPDKWTLFKNQILVKEILGKGKLMYKNDYIAKSGEVIPIKAKVFLIESEIGEKQIWGTFERNEPHPTEDIN